MHARQLPESRYRIALWPVHGIMQNNNDNEQQTHSHTHNNDDNNRYEPSSNALSDIKNKRAQNKHPIDMKYSNIFNRGNTKFLRMV